MIHRSITRTFPVHPIHTFLKPLLLLHLLSLPLLVRWLTPQPKRHKCYPTSNCDPNACDPYPPTANLPTARILIVCKMPDGDLLLYIHICDERPLVVDTKAEDPVLIRESERCAEECTVRGRRNRM